MADPYYSIGPFTSSQALQVEGGSKFSVKMRKILHTGVARSSG